MMRKLILCVCAVLLAGCPQQEQKADGASASPAVSGTVAQPPPAVDSKDGAPVEVWADPALVPVLDVLAEDFKAIYPPGYTVEAKERGDLLAHLGEEGEPAMPAVLCADGKALEPYCTQGHAEAETLRTFAGDRLVLAERPGTGYKSPSLFDIYELRFEKLGLGEPETLAGYYGEQALISEGVMNRITDRVERYPATAALIDALKLDEVDVILLPASAAAVNDVSAWLLIGEDLHEDIRYQAAAGKDQQDSPGVAELLRFLAEDDEVQNKLEGYGLVRRETALVENP